MALSIDLNKRQVNDLELLLDGSFSPVNYYMNKNEYLSVLDNMRLLNGELFPLPINLMINKKKYDEIKEEKIVLLKDPTGLSIASLKIEEIFQPDINNECLKIYNSIDTRHPYISYLQSKKGCYYVAGKLEKVGDILHYDFKDIRKNPSEMKQFFKDNNWNTIVGFHVRNPIYKYHYEITKYCLNQIEDDNPKLLIHPISGKTHSFDIDYNIRAKCYKKILKNYSQNTVTLSLLELAMRLAGPRETLLHAIIRKNYGCTHFIVLNDHAGPSISKKNGELFFEKNECSKLALQHENELGIKLIFPELIYYDSSVQKYLPVSQINDKKNIMKISGTDFRTMMEFGDDIPNWFCFPEIVKELKKFYRVRKDKGLCIYLVGLSGSGKSTIANFLKQKLDEIIGNKKITLLDGDVIRKNLSKGLGFSKEDRSTNIRRIGYVASEIVKHSGIVLCANIAPFEEDRSYNRRIIGNEGNYIEIYVNTKLDVCEDRDVKGLYKLARSGVIKNFTGISDPFETPEYANLEIDGSNNIDQSLDIIIDYLRTNKYI